MKIVITLLLILFANHSFSGSHQLVNPWPDVKLKGIEIILKENDKTWGVFKNNAGQFISLKTNKVLNGKHEIDGTLYPFKNGLLHGEVFGATYKNGQLNGMMRQYTTWYNKSKVPSFLSAKLNFLNGVLSGAQNWYDPLGNIIETAFYQNGKRVSHKKIFQKVKSKYSDEPRYKNKKAEATHKLLEICSKSKVKKIFDNHSHIYIFTGSDLDPNCLQKNTHLTAIINTLLQLIKTFPGAAQIKKMKL